MFYDISPDLSACPPFPTTPSLLLPSPPTHPLPPTSTPLHPLCQSLPVTTISRQPRPPSSAPSSCRGPESVVSKCTARPCSASLIYKPWSPQIPPPPSLPQAVGITSPPPPVSAAVYLLSDLQPRVESFPGPVPCGGWWNQCIQHVIRVEEVWEIGARV